jgi:hypothetical protein
MLFLVISLYFLQFIWITYVNSTSYVHDILKPQFYREFTQMCSKYPFYHNYLNNLKYPPGRFVVFVFQEANLKTGGMGDRMAGLLTAAGMAIRYNRTLIIRSQNGLEKLFRPYIPPEDEDSLVGLVKYGNGSHDLDWARYNLSYENREETELNISYCINHSAYLNPMENKCAHLGINPEQQIIVFRGNRCYLCYWYMNKQAKARHQLIRAIGGKGRYDDLYRVAGCLLRLTLWPTDYFWSKVDEAYQKHYQFLLQMNLLPTSIDKSRPLEFSRSILPKYVFTLHFRCGDAAWKAKPIEYCQHSFRYNHNISNSPIQKLRFNIPPHEESPNMVYGTPDTIARCARERLLGLLGDEASQKQPVYTKVAVNLLSDNIGSYNQMNNILQWKNLVQAPHTCHIDLDHSFECLADTTVYWFIMAMSDYFVVPSNDENVPVSGFSRYAAVYGLKEGSLINGRTCQLIVRGPLSRKHHENWFCHIPQ